MDFGEKERQVVLVALRRYLRELEQRINSEEAGEDEVADLGNDAALVDLLISRFEQEG